MSGWHSPVVDFLRTRLPADSSLRPYAKRVVEDGRSLLHVGRRWEHLEANRPAVLYVEPTNICNANCVFCAYQFQDRLRTGRGMMSLETFASAIDGHRTLGGTRVELTPLVGEPLLDPGLTDKIRLAKAQGCIVGLYTNGIRLNRIDLEEFIESGIDSVRISTSPFDRATFERIYRSSLYSDLREGVHRLLVTRNRLGATTRISLQFRSDVPLDVIRQHADFRAVIDPHLRDSERRTLYAQVRSFDSWSGQIAAEDLPAGMTLAKPPRLHWRPCHWTFAMLVLYDGAVRACGARFGPRSGPAEMPSAPDLTDDLAIGHLQDQDLPTIWQGEPLRRLRQRFAAGNPPSTCQTCTMYRPI